MHKGGKCGVHCVAWWLTIIGGLNWGLVGLFDWNVVEVLFGSWGWLVTLLYILIGLSAVALLLERPCRKCK